MATEIHTWKFPDVVTALVTSADGRLVVTGCQDGRMRVHNCTTHELLCENTEEKCDSIFALAVCTRDDECCNLLVVTGHSEWIVRCWRVDVTARQVRLEWVGDGAREGRKKGYICSAMTACISHDRDWVAVGGQNCRDDGSGSVYDICLFSLPTDDDDDGSVGAPPPPPSSLSSCVRRPDRVFAGHTRVPRGLCFSPDDCFLVSGSQDKTLRVWSVATGAQLQFVRVDSSLWSMALRRCAKELITGHEDGSVRVWSLDQHSLRAKSVRWRAFDTCIRVIRHTEDWKRVVLGGDYKVCIQNLASGEEVARLEGFSSVVAGVGVTSTGNVVSCSYGTTVRLSHLGDPDLRRAIAPVRTLLVKERAALQRARVSSSPLTTVVLTIMTMGHTRRIGVLSSTSS